MKRDRSGRPGEADDLLSFRTQDVTTPLACMLGCAELIESGDLNHDQRQIYTSIMLREGRRLTELIENAKALDGFESGHRKIYPSPVDLHSLMNRAVAAAGDDDARPIEVHVAEKLPLVSADPEAILGALVSFLANARRFSPDGGVIRIAARSVGDMVQVHIRDHGIGIEVRDLPRVFDKHFRSNREMRRLVPGAGFTLALNQRVIEEHGGRVEATSKGPGCGADFQFTLQVSQPGAVSGDVLIVEDEAGLARIMQAEFAAHGLSAIRADDAETAVHVLADLTPRAILLDLALPGLKGEDFLARISVGRVRLPVVVLTSYDMGDRRISALESAGVAAVLPKEAGAPQAAVALIAQALAPGGPAK